MFGRSLPSSFRAAIVTLCLVVVSVISAHGKALPEKTFAVQVFGADPELRLRTQQIITKAHETLKNRSGLGFNDTIDVVYVMKGQTFDSIAGGHFPDWGIGVAITEKNLIALRSPRDYPIGDQLANILRHELAHLHLELILGGHRPPRWVHEGYAQQFAHEWNFGDDWKVARAVFTGSTIPLSDINGVNSFQGAQAELAYIQSYLAMGHFLQKYGWDGLMLLARSMQDGDNWDAAFMAATGADYATYQEEFADYLSERFNWASFLGDTILFWIFAALIFVALYIWKRRRSKRRLADWKRQEDLEDVLYAPFDIQRPQRPGGPEHDNSSPGR